MLGVTGILVGTVFLTSIFLQTVLGFSALRDRPRVPAVRARHHRRHASSPGTLLAHVSPRAIAAVGLLHQRRRRGAAVHAPTAARRFATDLLPGLVALGLGVGMVFVPVSVTVDGRHPASARRRGLRLPDDRPRGRRRPRRRRPVRGRQHRRAP